MQEEIVEQHIEASLKRLAKLWQQTKEFPIQQKKVLVESLEEHDRSLHELQVMVEELRKQNEVLEATRQAVEVERWRYQELFEFAPDAYLVTDSQTIILEANQAAATLLNVPQKKLVGKPLAVFLAGEGRSKFWTRLNQLMSSQGVSSWEDWLQPREGMSFPTALRVAAVRNTEGELVGWRWLLQNISEHQQCKAALERASQDLERLVEERTAELWKSNQQLRHEIAKRQAAEATLQISEERYRVLAESLPQLVWSINCDGRVEYCNQHWCDYTGLTLEQSLGTGWVSVLHPEDLERTLESWHQANQTGEGYKIEYRFKRAVDGIYRWHLVRILPIKNPSGQIVKWIGTATDIDDCKESLSVSVSVSEAAALQQATALQPTSLEGIVTRSTEALRQQAERERLISVITQRIRSSLNLEEILNTTVAEVRQFLQVDRVLVYRIEPSGAGVVLAESADAASPSLLGIKIDTPLFRERTALWRQGHTLTISDMEQTEVPVAINEYLQQNQVKASLSVPILQNNPEFLTLNSQLDRNSGARSQESGVERQRGDIRGVSSIPLPTAHSPLSLTKSKIQNSQLWGLIATHQCSGPRQWQPLEIDLLNQLATQVSIAIQQSELYQQVQQLNTDLERRVRERTAQLQKALDFESMLKRITDDVRDSLDEAQILQVAVWELAVVLNLEGCDTAMYDDAHITSTITHEYAPGIPSAVGYQVQMANFWECYSQLLGGQHFQFCRLTPSIRGPVAMLACPIFDNQGVLGDLWLYKKQGEAFDHLEIQLAQLVANQCAIAIRQARLYQAAQAQVAELKKLDHLKDDFLNTVSHELRTPVANMKMAIQMLGIMLNREHGLFAELSKPKTEQSRLARYFQILHNECEREICLIDDLLNLQRLYVGAQPTLLTSIQLQEWLPSIVEPFQERARTRQQSLLVDIDSQMPSLMCNPSNLGRIVSELLNNACKFTPSGEKIQLVAQMQSGILQLSVSNSGVEIPVSEIPRIFDKFYRIPSDDPWKEGGTGLGLTLVKKLVIHLGGTIQVKSEFKQTCFTVELPVNTNVISAEITNS